MTKDVAILTSSIFQLWNPFIYWQLIPGAREIACINQRVFFESLTASVKEVLNEKQHSIKRFVDAIYER